MAIGQLFDYRRLMQRAGKGVSALAILLPKRPEPEIKSLLKSVEIAMMIWRNGKAFNDNCGGRFVNHEQLRVMAQSEKRYRHPCSVPKRSDNTIHSSTLAPALMVTSFTNWFLVLRMFRLVSAAFLTFPYFMKLS
jgi:hypothetical protein